MKKKIKGKKLSVMGTRKKEFWDFVEEVFGKDNYVIFEIRKKEIVVEFKERWVGIRFGQTMNERFKLDVKMERKEKGILVKIGREGWFMDF